MPQTNPQLPPISDPLSDPLGEALHLLRLTGSLYCRSELTAPWGIEIPAFNDMMMFMIVTSGSCWLEIGDTKPRLLEQGSLTLIPHGTAHIVRSDQPVDIQPLFELPVEKISDRYEVLHFGGGGELTQVMYCVIRFDHVVGQNLIEQLPEVLQINNWDEDVGNWLQSTLQFISLEARALRPGGETIITRLADILVIQAIRSWLDTTSNIDQGWLAALRDKKVGRALAAIHRMPERNWSVISLAREIGMSRSAFSKRFTKLVGKPVMSYLTQWRMQLARASIQETSEPLSIIANNVGYKSEAAFCRVFKRQFGVPPGNFRSAKTQSQPAL